MIGDFTGSKTSAFPFGLAAKDGQVIYSPDSAPKGFCLNDPDHYTAFKIDALYTHWMERQRKGLQPFVVLNASPHHGMSVKKSKKGKGKAKADYVEVNSDDASVRGSGEEGANEQEEKKVPEDEGREDEGCEDEGREDEGREDEGCEDEGREDEGREDEGHEDEGREGISDVDEDISAAKYGPPIGKKKQIPLYNVAGPLTLPPVAGSSTLPPLEHASGKVSKTSSNPLNVARYEPSSTEMTKRTPYLNLQEKVKESMTGKMKKGKDHTKAFSVIQPSDKPTTRSTLKNNNLKKRKLEEDLTIGLPQKSGRKGRKKLIDEPVEVKPLKTGRQMKNDQSKIKTGKKRKHQDESQTETANKRKRQDEQELIAVSSGNTK
jgi:hypothetical protein